MFLGSFEGWNLPFSKLVCHVGSWEKKKMNVVRYSNLNIRDVVSMSSFAERWHVKDCTMKTFK